MHKRNRISLKLIQGILIIIMVFLISTIMVTVHDLQGNSRVVNYTGIVRGGTQRLVKQELANKPNDNLINYIDTIISSLQNGNNALNLKRLNDLTYQQQLDSLSLRWDKLKELIIEYRKNPEVKNRLYDYSEIHFDISNKATGSAEAYSDEIVRSLKLQEFILIFVIVLIILLLVKQTIDYIVLTRQNRSLNKLAYVDGSSGLPNKTACELMLQSNQILNTDKEACCIMFDLNGLKTVNDTLGHYAGDTLIYNFAKVLKDTAPSKTFIGRFGGDEFIAIDLDTNKEEMEMFLDNLRENIEKVNLSSGPAKISYAYGYQLSDEDTQCSLKCLLDKADKKMYINKQTTKK
ncbi:MAG: GGDEF domain-containing protein [Eubacteriales bacterium]|nr:GGDEF domain-containing protein [Eubacteriales bacterium]